METIRAFMGPSASNAKNLGQVKETIRTLDVVVVTGKSTGLVPVTTRWYMSRSPRASVVYCSVWIHAPMILHSGHGTANGHGYCKKSAAFAQALKSANITLTSPVSGRGMTLVREACTAIVRSLGIRGRLIFVD